MDTKELTQRILELVSGENYQPVKPKVITKKLGLPKERVKEVRRIIKRLSKEGQIAVGGGRQVKPTGAGSGHITGTFRRTAKGSGFVRPRSATTVSDKREDILIPADRTQDASSGDIVLVQLRKRRGAGGRRTGEVVEVIERESHQFVGTYFEARGAGYVQIDGKVFTNPVPVGDPGAKSAQPEDKVVIEMVRFPTHWHEGEGVIVEVLGPRGDPQVDTLSIIREFNLPGDFAEDTLNNARAQADVFDEALADRVDLTDLTVITIDPKDARDFDDAISLERIEKDHWRLGVHIADVSHFVQAGSPLDKEARDRATSIYLPDRVIPMIPEIISNNLASLQPDRVRYTKTVFIEMTPEGARVAVEPVAGAIKSCRRFTYEEVDDYLSRPDRWKKKLTAEVHALLAHMHELAMILRARRFQRGALELTMGETEIDLDRQGKVSGAHVREHTASHQIIEEFMLAANEAVAEMLDDRETFFLRRIHAPPDVRKLRDLTEFVRELEIECDSLEDRFEIQRVLDAVKGEPFERAVNFAVLRSMSKAVYGPEEVGHYALASKNYCHFTSPIRRYPDLTVHRLLDAIIAERPPVADYEQLVVLGQHCSDREQRAEAAERELIKVKLLNFFAQRIGEQMDAVITGVQDFGMFAQGREIPVEGLIHISSMTDDYYDYDSATHTLAGKKADNQYRLGDLVRVEVVHVDVDRRELDFRLLGLIKHPLRTRRGKPTRKAVPAGGKRAAKGRSRSGRSGGNSTKKSKRSKTAKKKTKTTTAQGRKKKKRTSRKKTTKRKKR